MSVGGGIGVGTIQIAQLEQIVRDCPLDSPMWPIARDELARRWVNRECRRPYYEKLFSPLANARYAWKLFNESVPQVVQQIAAAARLIRTAEEQARRARVVQYLESAE